MKRIDAIVVHCSATYEGADIKLDDIDRMHRSRGFNGCGYHYVIELDGTVRVGRSLSRIGAHCNNKSKDGTSYNRHSIGICYIGGLDKNGKAKDTRTEAQKLSMLDLIFKLTETYPIKEIIGHRDASPDLNGNGIVEPSEWIKMCPCFDAKKEYEDML